MDDMVSWLRIILSCSMGIVFSLIISVQNISIKQIVHTSSGSSCSCGCQDGGGSCGGTCCSTQSLSQCGCTEPHETIVVFIIPGHLDSFLQTDYEAHNIQVLAENKYKNEVNFYESLYFEPPAPIPIV